jgi:hypothetical protein
VLLGIDPDEFTVKFINPIPLNYASQFKIFPNPAKSRVTILPMIGDTDFSTEIIDLQGTRMISNHHHLGQAELELFDIMPGIYLIRIISDDGHREYGKIIIIN